MYGGSRSLRTPGSATVLYHHIQDLKHIIYFIPEKPGRYIYSLGDRIENEDDSCEEWFKSENEGNAKSKVSEPCPCTKEQAVLDGRFVTDPDMTGCYITRRGRQKTNQICCYQEYVSDCLANQGITLSY